MLIKLGKTIRPLGDLPFLPCFMTDVECTAAPLP